MGDDTFRLSSQSETALKLLTVDCKLHFVSVRICNEEWISLKQWHVWNISCSC